jgi:hypothetical protein
MESKEIIEGNKLIWNFMGGKWQPTENAGANGMKSYEPCHDTFEECEKACVEINRLKSGSPRNIVYAVPSPAKNTIDRELKYHSSWDWLMPVVEKIESDASQEAGHAEVTITENHCRINRMSYTKDLVNTFNKDSKILAVWQAVVQFVTWYNSKTNQQISKKEEK